MSMKSISHNKLHEVANLLKGIASNAQDPAHAVEFIESARDWYEDEIGRLSELIVHGQHALSGCPWCGSSRSGGSQYSGGPCDVEPHASDCDAFEPNGDLR